MDTTSKKSNHIRHTTIAAIIALVLIFFTLYVEILSDTSLEFSISGISKLLTSSPIYLIFIIILILVIVATYFILKNFTSEVNTKEALVEKEKERIRQVENFTQKLIHDNLDVKLDESENEDDTLKKSLHNLRDTLKENKKTDLELRKQEEQRNWIAEGLAHISEILRNYIHDLEQLSFRVIKDLTKYIDAIQGGFYMLHDEDTDEKYFILNAFFAYDRKKFANQKIKWGDGLIGTCALEQKTINLKNVPDSYISVTSGLGEANPGNVIIVPMIYENHVYGVLEFASFNNFDQIQINLIEKAAESIAATLSAGRINLNTARLLEESKAQTQALTSHEEEMRQNMEELQATQEEASRQSERLMILEDTINKNLIRAEFSSKGILMSANNLFIEKFEYAKDQSVEGKQVTEFINTEEREVFKEHWKKLVKNNKPFRGYIKHVTRTGKDLWVAAALNIIKSTETSETKVVYLALDNSEEILKVQKQERIAESVSKNNIKIELDINGNFLEGNNNFVQLFEISKQDLKSLSVFDLIMPIELEAFNKQWDGIIKGQDYFATVKCKTGKDKTLWLKGTFNPVYSTAHEIDRIIFIGHDNTHEKEMETEIKDLHEKVKQQEKMLREAEKKLINKIRETKDELIGHYKETERIKNIHESILENSPDAVITTSQDNRIVSFNKAAEKLWGLNRKDVLNHEINILFPEKLTEKDELIGSFTRPGNNKITGQRRKSTIVNKEGKEINVTILLSKARVENENSYMAFIQIDI